MHLQRLDDYQSWLLTVCGHSIAIDPWLTRSHKLPPGHWLFGRERDSVATPAQELSDVDALIITGPFADHCDEETLSVLPRDVPAFANVQAARRLVRMGFKRVTTLRDGTTVTPFEGVTLEPVQPGFPYRHNSIGFVVGDGKKRLYFETHTVDVKRHGARVRGVDAAVMPVQGVRLLGVPFVMSPERACAVTRELGLRHVIATGNDPQLAHGLLSRVFLFTQGTLDGFARLLEERGVGARFSNLRPRETVEI